MSAKTIAKCFWNRETELELAALGLREQWLFKSEKDVALSGTIDDVMEFIDRKRCGEFYSHNCSSHCQGKGKVAEIMHIAFYVF